MLPLASSSGLAIIGGAVSGAILLMIWLLHGEARDEALEEAQRGETDGGETDGARAAERHGVG